MKRVLLMITFTLSFLGISHAQSQSLDTVYTAEYLSKSTQFAQLTLGFDMLSLGGGTTHYLRQSSLQSESFSGTVIPRITIGGTHFWGHADFYVSFPVASFSKGFNADVFDEVLYARGIETGARVYPWAIKPGRLVPFAGINFSARAFGFEPKNSGFTKSFPVYDGFVFPLQLGATYTTEKFQFTASAYLLLDRTIDYSLSENQKGRVTFEPWSFQLGVVRYLDTNANARSKKGIQQLNLKHQLLAKDKKLSAFYLAAGPTSFIQTSQSSYFQKYLPHLADDNLTTLSADLAAGYYFEKPDLNIGISYRGMKQSIKSIDDEVGVKRKSILLESYKFLFNYHGFVPFIGATVGLEGLSAQVNDQEYKETKPAVGLVFGWEIRVVKTEGWLLRTNFRYTPNLHLEIDDERIMFDHLEFNFIQYVHFIGRRKYFEQYRK